MNLADLDLKYDAVTVVPLNNSEVLLATMNDEYITDLKNHFKNQVKHAKFSASYKSGNWDGFIRFIKNDGTMPRGLLPECIKKMEEWEIKYELDPSLVHKELDISNFEEVIKSELIAKQEGGVELLPWEHQWDSAKALLKAKRGIVRAATSSGKSYIVTMVTKYLLHMKYVKKVLLVVPRTDLVIQMEKDAEEYGFDRKDIGVYFGREKDYEGKSYVISTWQSLQNIESREFFEEFDCLIIDEIHGAKSGDKSSKSKRSGGTVMRQICDHCVNAEWRFGCTGTMPTDPLDVRTVISGVGPVVHEVNAKDLMDKGHVTELKITIPFISYDKKMVKEKINEYLLENDIDEDTPKEAIPAAAKFNAEKKFIENYVPRLKLISKIVLSRLEKEENVLILANTLNFGKKLQKTITHLNKGKYNDIFYISGEMDEYKRKEIREKMEDGSRIVVIATTSLFSTGISVKNLHTVIFGNIGKSKITVLQSVGRVLRKHCSKEVARIYDLCDNLTYNAKHAKERMEHYSLEKFDINIKEISI